MMPVLKDMNKFKGCQNSTKSVLPQFIEMQQVQSMAILERDVSTHVIAR